MSASKELAARVARNTTAYSPSPKRDTTLHLRALADAIDGIESYEDQLLKAESAALVATRILAFLCFEKHGRAYNRGEEKVTTSQVASDVKIITLKHRAHEGKVVYVGSEATAARIKAAVGDAAKRELVNLYLAKPKNGEKRQLVAGIKVPFSMMVKVYEHLIANYGDISKQIAAMESAEGQMDAFATLMQEAFVPPGETLTFAALRDFFAQLKPEKPELTAIQKFKAQVSKITDLAELDEMAKVLVARIQDIQRQHEALDGAENEGEGESGEQDNVEQLAA